MSMAATRIPRKRGRPPNEAARRSVLAAARELMTEGGIAAVTIEALATRTGVTRPTIYRHWPNAQAVAMAALIDDGVPGASDAPPSTLEKDLEDELLSVVQAFASPTGRSALALVASADLSTELAKAFRHHVLLKSRDRVRARLQLAAEQGRLAKGCDIESLADIALAPLFFRLLLGHAPISPAFARDCVKHLIAGCTAQPKRSGPRRDGT